ncbi:hypothetical protein [Cryobacterium sp. SO1]|uniref:hypothetical protein n=1 Tax=Cryobacterium sp. SO1 TaxID=1897061 RepID=UPI0010E1D147|nr:hypothetical protein [Cryobacterium sp. SO1]RZI37296.1 hypothetical protein BJQ95_00286 [Cryobacterium sp. SO1]
MNTDDKNHPKVPDGSTDLSSADAAHTEELADGSQSDGSASTGDDTASGGAAD